jgi:hypothetical protein
LKLDVVESYGATGPCFRQPDAGPFKCTWDPVKELNHVSWVRVSFIESLREKRSSQSPFLYVRALGQLGELLSSFGVKGHIHATHHSVTH